MPSMNCLQVELEIGRIVRAMMTRNREIGQDLIAYLRMQLPTSEVAGLVIISIERLMWFDPDAILWAVEQMIPSDVMQEVRQITTITIYKYLTSKGFVPGKDISVDAEGKLLLNKQVLASVPVKIS
ncbi:hypothetical protein [Synechocystis sp. PCC 7509]|uniref:hypothetical protein n=1 Tax=Synechocystis sp. PCC 7509 TaxID=927677 RepID=UPI0002ACC5AE|nr:hypothetical protein [Synechocystis sp. PCC 7509]